MGGDVAEQLPRMLGKRGFKFRLQTKVTRADKHPDRVVLDLARTVHAHPTLPESIKEAALVLQGHAMHI